jgi:hypothetical protein
MYPPLATWSGAARQVRLVLPYRMNCAVYELLVNVAKTANVPLSNPTDVARRAAQTLATEMMRRPAMSTMGPDLKSSMTVPQSEALSLLAWMLSSPATDDAGHPLRPLIDSLHQLLT